MRTGQTSLLTHGIHLMVPLYFSSLSLPLTNLFWFLSIYLSINIYLSSLSPFAFDLPVLVPSYPSSLPSLCPYQRLQPLPPSQGQVVLRHPHSAIAGHVDLLVGLHCVEASSAPVESIIF